MEDDDQENQSIPIKREKDDNHESFTPVSGDHKLKVVLKIPKMKVGEDGQISSQEKDQTRVCSKCNKRFSSGKALGGHMRIHVSENKLLSLKKLKLNQATKCKNHHQHKDIVLIKNQKKTTNALLGDTGKPICVICGKNFPSMKSLFGHMRCHPEREWRGIQPPLEEKNSPSSSLSDDLPGKINDHVDLDGTSGTREIDLAVSLPGWSVTAKRGRKANNPTWSSSSSEDEFRDAADDLMRLAKGEYSFDSSGLTTHKHRTEEMEATNSNSLTYKAEIDDTKKISELEKERINEVSLVKQREDSPVQKLRIEERGSPYDGNIGGLLSKSMNIIIDKGKERVFCETDCVAEKSVDMDSQWDIDTCSEDTEKLLNYHESTNGEVIVIKNKKKRKKMKLVELGSVQEISPPYQKVVGGTTSLMPREYRCSTCNKCFLSHQALGGHRSSHNKFRINIHNTIDESSSAAAEDENPACPITQNDEIKESEGAASSKLMNSTHHQCKICNRTFNTGQALGGHKRCHWTGPVLEALSSQLVTSPGEASETGRKILPFDLNELPPVEDEGGLIDQSEHGTGYGDASSSYNSIA